MEVELKDISKAVKKVNVAFDAYKETNDQRLEGR